MFEFGGLFPKVGRVGWCVGLAAEFGNVGGAVG